MAQSLVSCFLTHGLEASDCPQRQISVLPQTCNLAPWSRNLATPASYSHNGGDSGSTLPGSVIRRAAVNDNDCCFRVKNTAGQSLFDAETVNITRCGHSKRCSHDALMRRSHMRCAALVKSCYTSAVQQC